MADSWRIVLDFPWNVAWQSSGLLGAGLLVSLAWRRRPARAHAALGLAMAACLVVPAIGALAGAMDWGFVGRAPSLRAGLDTSSLRQGQGTTSLRESSGRSSLREGMEPLPTRDGSGASSLRDESPRGARGYPESRRGATGYPVRAVLLGAWSVASALLLASLLVSWVRGARIAGRARPIDDPSLHAALRSAAAGLGIAAPRALRASSSVATPSIWCLSRRPVVLLPEGWQRTCCIDWAGVFAHELAHLRRRDHLWVLLAELAARLLPWNPLVWMARSRAGALAERACDDWAVQGAPNAVSYAESLLALAPSRGPALALGAVSSKRGLMSRVPRILSGARAAPRTGRAWLATAALLAAAAAGMAALTREGSMIADPPSQPEGAGPDGSATAARYARLLADLDGKGWREAFALGQEIAGLPPEEGWAILRDNWSKVAAVQARQQFLKAWQYRAPDGTTPSRLADRGHPRLLDALHLGMTDSSPQVQAYAGTFLRPIAFRDFAFEPEAYEAWHRMAAARPVPDIAADSCRSWVSRLLAGEPAATRLMAEGDRLFRDAPEARAAAVKAGLPAALEAIFTGEGARSAERNAFDPVCQAITLFVALDPGEAELRRAILPLIGRGHTQEVRCSAIYNLGSPKSRWAMEPLRRLLVGAMYDEADREEGVIILFMAAKALAAIGDPTVIPSMIGVIDADNTEDTVYWVGHFGLRDLTGVPYDARFDGPWWRAWWEKNKGRFPAEAQATPIPDLPKARSYVPRVYDHAEWVGTVDQEPLDRMIAELHRSLLRGDSTRKSGLVGAIARRNDPRSIPLLIGVMDSDNRPDTLSDIGHAGLCGLTKVPWDDRYDGPWWRAWWAKNKGRFPAEAQATPIPDLPRTPGYVPRVYDHGKWIGTEGEEPVERLVDELHRRLVAGGGEAAMYGPSQKIAERADPRTIPMLIGVIDADNTHDTIYGVGYFGLGNVTGVRFDSRHDGPWWRAWWERNKGRYPAEAQAGPIPDLAPSAKHVPTVYDHGEWIGTDDEPIERTIAELGRRQAAGDVLWTSTLGGAIGERGDPRAIPLLIELVEPLNDSGSTQGVNDALSKLTNVPYDASHDAAWWRAWWEKNKGRYGDAKKGGS